jgi:hypothetical protein
VEVLLRQAQAQTPPPSSISTASNEETPKWNGVLRW